MEEESVPLHEEQVSAEEVVESMQQDVAEDTRPEVREQEEKRVPLSALQKERKKRQELEMQIEWERQQRNQPQQAPKEEDTSRYESATKEDLSRSQHEAVRIIEEKIWIKNNPEKFERVDEYLEEFLKQRPNLRSAIRDATNRYEEAFTLMEALTPKQKQQLKAPTPKKDAPGNPASVPKGAALNQAIDVMSMSDHEFTAWRSSQKRRR